MTVDPADIDTAHAPTDLSSLTLSSLLERMERSAAREQMTYRECELNEALRIIDGALYDPATLHAERQRLKALAAGVREVHRLVGSEEQPAQAAALLRELIV